MIVKKEIVGIYRDYLEFMLRDKRTIKWFEQQLGIKFTYDNVNRLSNEKEVRSKVLSKWKEDPLIIMEKYLVTLPNLYEITGSEETEFLIYKITNKK